MAAKAIDKIDRWSISTSAHSHKIAWLYAHPNLLTIFHRQNKINNPLESTIYRIAAYPCVAVAVSVCLRCYWPSEQMDYIRRHQSYIILIHVIWIAALNSQQLHILTHNGQCLRLMQPFLNCLSILWRYDTCSFIIDHLIRKLIKYPVYPSWSGSSRISIFGHIK